MKEFYYRCFDCGETYKRDQVRYLCLTCGKNYHAGKPLSGVLEAIFDYAYIEKNFQRQQPNWQLFSAVEEKYFPAYPVGNTPFFLAPGLSETFEYKNVWIKHDGLNPSCSLKDRASFLVVAEAIRLGIKDVVTASTGNAACALAAVAAAAGLRAKIFLPRLTPPEKLFQIKQHGADVELVHGTYADAFQTSLDYSRGNKNLNRNTAYNPLTIEGKKTVGFEIYAQNHFRIPDAIIIPVGDGVIISGVYKAFQDLKRANIISRLPRLICIQSENSSAIHHYIQSGIYHNAKQPNTVADSISVSIPANAHMAKFAVIESKGFSLTVSDEEIIVARSLLARKAGVFAEPAAAATMAGLQKIQQNHLLPRAAQIVLLITGHGLKDCRIHDENIK